MDQIIIRIITLQHINDPIFIFFYDVTYIWQVAFFTTEVYSRDCEIKLQALKIDENSEMLRKALIQSIVENSTTHNVKRMRDLIVHRYEDEQRVSLAVENKVH